MPISPARETAYRILRRVESGRAFAVDLLQGPEAAALRDSDRRLATEIVMGVLRWGGELDFQIEQLSGKAIGYFDAEVRTVLRMGVYQLRFLERIPPSAVVNEAVELTKAARKRSAAGLVNAVLRKCQPRKIQPASTEQLGHDPELRDAIRRTLPAWLFERWRQNFWNDAALDLAWAANKVPATTLRVTQGGREEVRQRLAAEGVETQPGRWSRAALTVQAGNVQATGAFRQGEVLIQDEGSQLVAELAAPEAGERVLDLCAAPGIKAAQIAASLDRGTLIASDVSAPRLRTMTRLLAGRIPAGVQMHVVRLDAAAALPFGGSFDTVLVDAPCSGTGTLARNPEIKWRLHPKDLERLSELQGRMLRNALGVVASGGRLVYSTCSLEPEENERVVESALREAGGFRQLTAAELASMFPALGELFDQQGYFRTRPDTHRMDGFFAAVIERIRS